MTRLVPTGALANEALAQGGSVRAAAMLFAVVVAVVAFGAMSLLVRVFREAVRMSMRLFAAALATAAIGLIAVILIGTLLFGALAPQAGAATGADTTSQE